MDDDTIFALSSGAPPAAIAVMRVSGPRAGEALTTLAGQLPLPRRATLRDVRGTDGGLLDHALLLWFPGPDTVTGEDIAELHLHGGKATVAALTEALRAQGIRPAVGGEFTRRALVNGRIDVTQAEGLVDLLAAETEQERRVALATSEGQLSRALHGWYERLTAISAQLEAQIDHSDEADVAVDRHGIVDALELLLGQVDDILEQPTVERLRNGPVIVLAGPPNAGKSSLFNALCERDAAIVTAIAGTTRDVLDASVSRTGRNYRLLDTAGVTVTSDPVEQIGVERAIAAAADADLIIWMGDEAPFEENALWINARCDLAGREALEGAVLSVSVRRPQTVSALWATIDDRLRSFAPRSDSVLLAARQRDSVLELRGALLTAAQSKDELVQAEAVRLALRSLDGVLGLNAPEAMLDALFSRFCIGK